MDQQPSPGLRPKMEMQQYLGMLTRILQGDSLSETDCEECVVCGLEGFAYFFAGNGPPAVFAPIYRQYAARSLVLETARIELEALFRTDRIRFAWLKGADLASEVYPAAALRLHGDLDVLVHPEDCPRALARLSANEWETPFQLTSPHHHPPMRKKAVSLEIHFRLPNFPGVPIAELWAQCRPTDEFRHQLSPELRLLLTVQHAAGNCWRAADWRKVFRDLYFLSVRNDLDEKLVTDLVERWQLFHPDLLRHAYPDFFRPPYPPRFRPEIYAAMREVIDRTPAAQNSGLAFPLAEKFSPAWWRARLAGFQPENIRFKYRLPPNARLRLALCTVHDGWRKACAVFKWHGSREAASAADFMRQVDILDSTRGGTDIDW